jgi:hypothetical protein
MQIKINSHLLQVDDVVRYASLGAERGLEVPDEVEALLEVHRIPGEVVRGD